MEMRNNEWSLAGLEGERGGGGGGVRERDSGEIGVRDDGRGGRERERGK